MSKRDTIIVAVLVNIGLLAILFMLAVNRSDDGISDSTDMAFTLEESTPIPQMPTFTPVVIEQSTPRDEVDDVLYGRTPAATEVILPTQTYVEAPYTPPVKETAASPSAKNEGVYGEVIVKSGDALEKIARANKTSVEEIKKINHLTSEKLSIGQVLKVPVNKGTKNPLASATAAQAATPSSPAPTTKVASNDPIYHLIKSGDNPWKIARLYKVKYEDILKLNNMSEEKARNLKVGDKIRVK